ncbi:MAG: Integral rane sensor signal transduction histidine kinase [Verrucomicrobiales bacterium]|nr:Integral rane sensor signal transduction histidine kinase [Verrucomicrobiales bacterium]
MNVRFPLYAKILLWFFLNLVIIGVGFLIFFNLEVGFNSAIERQVHDRLRPIEQLIMSELVPAGRSDWDGILKRFSAAYAVKFVLFRNNGDQVAGEKVTLPRDVVTELNQQGPRREGPPELAPDDPRRDEFAPPPEDDPERQRPRARGPMPMRLPAGAAGMFFVHSEGNYWAGLRTRIQRPDMPPQPMTLIAVSKTLSAGGLFVDFRPWAIAGLVVIVVSALFWFPIIRRLTHSVSKMTAATQSIAAGDFEARVADNRRDELGQLGEAINSMAVRLKGLVSGQKRFLGDTAHELCSPIARIQLQLGILEESAHPQDKPRIEDLREEIQQMSALVNELLSFSKASLEPAAVKLQPVRVRTVAEQAAKREAASDSQINVEVPEAIGVLGDPELLIRTIGNLLRNAIRYAGTCGPITITAERVDDLIRIHIRDCGPGVPDESLPQLFDPFYRPEVARDRESGGVGLGLAIVKTCVESCHGQVSCRNLKPGFEVTIELQAV